MKTPLTVLVCLAALCSSAAAQSACREASATITGRSDAFNILDVALPSVAGAVRAQALIPNKQGDAPGAFVFSLSRLIGSEPKQSVEMAAVAMELAAAGRPVIIVQRTLTWPTVDKSVGQMQRDALCAEQWLSAHAATKADDWEFVGPKADIPSFDQLHALGDNTSMVFAWGYPLGGPGDSKNTEDVLQRGTIERADLMDTHE